MRLPGIELSLNIAPFRVTGKSSRPSPGRLARARQKKAPLKPAPARAAACYSVELAAAGPGSEGGAQPTGRPRGRGHGHCAVAVCTSHRLGHNTQHQPTTPHTTPAHCQTPACQLPDPKPGAGRPAQRRLLAVSPGHCRLCTTRPALRVTSRGPATHIESRLAQRAPKCH